ncbi:hypothetical protein [Thermoflavimicrobium dichotomicum]|uniref:Uncharacterized protein n=1 Tax=Thermoflavimicrobium dichotomicum TaxID=46223 RepID=A0A1I3UQL6_9BACL|nr:hypothetical protein [Thermoflavimicrobium dichotomicum]SFJ84057.1 hypothetical protein SAMN05421852_1264 [Thermoflavimicrobium dichotomicum]
MRKLLDVVLFLISFSLLIYSVYYLLIDFVDFDLKSMFLDFLLIIISMFLIGWLFEVRNLFDTIMDEEFVILIFPFLLVYQAVVKVLNWFGFKRKEG